MKLRRCNLDRVVFLLSTLWKRRLVLISQASLENAEVEAGDPLLCCRVNLVYIRYPGPDDKILHELFEFGDMMRYSLLYSSMSMLSALLESLSFPSSCWAVEVFWEFACAEPFVRG